MSFMLHLIAKNVTLEKKVRTKQLFIFSSCFILVITGYKTGMHPVCHSIHTHTHFTIRGPFLELCIWELGGKRRIQEKPTQKKTPWNGCKKINPISCFVMASNNFTVCCSQIMTNIVCTVSHWPSLLLIIRLLSFSYHRIVSPSTRSMFCPDTQGKILNN